MTSSFDEVEQCHSLERTSPKGGPFIGTCRLCGKTDLLPRAVFEPCANPRMVTTGESLMAAIDGDEERER